jgi:GTPase
MSGSGDEREGEAGPAASVAPENRRCGFVAILGAPNAGKSTLVNALVGAKVTIVSRKVQTTRFPIRGIVMAGSAQIVLIDTPGIFAPRRRLDRAMVAAAWGGAADADVILLLVDAARGLDEDVERILKRLEGVKTPVILALNKIDRVHDKPKLLALAAELSKHHAFAEVLMIAALSSNGVAELKSRLAARMPLGPWHYPEDDISDAPLRLLAAEITREKIYERLHDELPYASTVETTAWKEFKDGSVRIEQTVFVERESQRAIVLGHRGSTLKDVGSRARAELAEILERKVHLFVFVKLRENWGSDPERYAAMGLDFPKE